MKKTTYFFSLLLLAFTFVQPSYAHRYFDSWRAQWCTPDPYLMLYPGWSPYNYGLCNPLRNIDPSGDTTYAYNQNHDLVPIDNSPDIISWGQQSPNYVSGNFTILTLAQYTVIDPFMGRFHYMQPNREIVPTANGARWFAPRPTISMGIVNIPGGPEELPSGLRVASSALKALFEGGTVEGKSIIGIRDLLLKSGFTQSLSESGGGYLFRNGLGEEVRIMNRNGGWEIRVMNEFGNYLDNAGNVAPDRASSHGIQVSPY